MTDPKHKGGWTPGPWNVSRNYDCDTLVRAGCPTTGMRVATTFASHATQANAETRLARIRTNEANARLIASAPEMADDGAFLLARLDEFEREVETESGDGAVRHWHGHVVPAIARFRAALAKAKASPDKSGGA